MVLTCYQDVAEHGDLHTGGVGRHSSVGIDSLRARRSGDRIPAEARFSAPV